MQVADISQLAMNAKEASSVEAAAKSCREPIMEPKLDGIRLLVNVDAGGNVWSYARSGKSKTGKLPLIDRELAQLPAGTWLDAEAIAFNEDGSQDWGGAQSVLGAGVDKAAERSEPIRLVVFDLIAYDGHDARPLPLIQRRELLEDIFAKFDFSRVQLSPQFEATQEAHDALVTAGYEGSMVKDLTASYASGKRTTAWTKVKLVETVDVVITGFKPGKGKFVNMIGALTFGQYREDGTFIADRGACSGMTDAQRADFTERIGELNGQVMEISFRTSMKDKKTGLPNYRHPQFERIRWDKTAEQCVVARVDN